MRCMLSDVSVQHSQLLLASVPKQATVDSTWQPLWAEIANSLTILANGGVVWVICGDLEFFCQEFQFPTAMSNYPCKYCCATNFFGKNEVPFTDFRSAAAWRSTKLEAVEDIVDHPLMDVPAISFWTIKLDWLHLVDLGCASQLFGNVVWDLIEDHLEGPSRAAKLLELNHMICKAYQENNIPASKRLGRLSLSDVCNGGDDYPSLRHQKGRRVRYFSLVACHLAAEFAVGDFGKHRLKAVEAMNDMYCLADRKEHVWSADTYNQFKQATHKMLLHYGWLAKKSMEKKLCRYSITQKHHKLACRYIDQCLYMAPRSTWCYGPESYMSMCIRIAAASVKGTGGTKLPGKVLQKFALCFHLLLSGQLNLKEDDAD
ncbi:unnamed protein product [Durusdinium trenchii]|uniref:Uncharacterized protein n=1 Tax=Durusdinium trenchii TaxID=1381693 RepID=A0ABP0IAI7_9DINO